MRSFRCDTCDQLVFFDNSTCLRCGSELGYVASERAMFALQLEDGALVVAGGSGRRYRSCLNASVARCNWLVPVDDDESLCDSCRLTTVRPSDDDVGAMAAFAHAEGAKRRLLDQLLGLSLPIIDRASDPDRGLAFELLSSRGRKVTTGHEGGVITLDLSESDDAHREFVRQQLGEPYRTVLGHLRHEVGHYFWPLLVVDSASLERFRELFGDDRQSYEEALEHHYRGFEATPWTSTHVSQYATVHPWEDWAETFAHYLHIRDGLETAASFGIVVGDPARSVGAGVRKAAPGPCPEAEPGEVEVEGQDRDEDRDEVGTMIDDWLGLTVALNAMSRSIGQGDLYPFVLSPVVIDKLEFVHQTIERAA